MALQRAADSMCRGARVALFPLAPACDDEGSSRLEHPDHLLDVLLLVRHVLPALARPHEVERLVRPLHREGIHHLEVDVAQAPAHAQP